MRAVQVAASVLWLTAASAWSPFAHIHPEDPGHHHGNGFAHPHAAHAAAQPGEKELEQDDHDEIAVWTEWAPNIAPRFALVYIPVAVAPAVVREFLPTGAAPQYTVRSHDPPPRGHLPARSPPV